MGAAVEKALSSAGRVSPDNGLTCGQCGGEAEKLYQNDTCKPCLLRSFARCIRMIDQYRAAGTNFSALA